MKHKLDPTGPIPSSHANVQDWREPLNTRQVYQMRLQRGVNLGSWFALEAWLTGSVFKHAKEPRGSDLDIVMGMDPTEARQILENHWDNFIDNGDWQVRCCTYQ